MAQQSKELYEFKKQLKALVGFSGRGTELISLYLTPEYPIAEATAKLRDEYGQASNIKSKATQQNVQAALEKVLQYLKTMGHKAPGTGVAIFCGNVSKVEGRPDVQLHAIFPPSPLQTQFYRCDSNFVLEPLEEMLEQTGSYGLVVLDGKDATVALLKGKVTKIIKKLHSTAHQKSSKGGQSAARFGRIHTEEVEVYYTRIGEAMAAFVGQKNFKGVLVGGPGPTKENFLRSHPFHHELKVLGVVDTGYADETGLRELLEKSGDLIAEQEAILEKKVLDEFMKSIATGGLSTYGFDDVRNALQAGKVSRLLISEGLELRELHLKCDNGHEEDRLIEGKAEGKSLACGKCSSQAKITGDRDFVQGLSDLAVSLGVEIVMVSRDTHEGEQFYGTFKGLGVFLRYR